MVEHRERKVGAGRDGPSGACCGFNVSATARHQGQNQGITPRSPILRTSQDQGQFRGVIEMGFYDQASSSRTSFGGTHRNAHFPFGVFSAANYGAAAAYPGKGTISQMRSAAAKLLGPAKGSSVKARLAINQCDPARDLVVKVVKTWVDAVWDRQLEPGVMNTAWKRAKSAGVVIFQLWMDIGPLISKTFFCVIFVFFLVFLDL